jgi:predicted phosphodiesterase
MKILIFGDNHGRIDNLLTVYEREKPDFTIHTGDYNDRDDNGKGTYIKDKYLKLFNKYIDGNNGCGLRAKNENDFLKNYLNDYQTFKLNNKFILLTHSWDNLDKEYPDIYRQRMGIIYDCKPDFIICGHTHTARI